MESTEQPFLKDETCTTVELSETPTVGVEIDTSLRGRFVRSPCSMPERKWNITRLYSDWKSDFFQSYFPIQHFFEAFQIEMRSETNKTQSKIF